MRVAVGMSGGVDSSVAAAILAEQGHDVVGVTLHLWDYTRTDHRGRCCAPEDQADARAVCDRLGLPHYVFDRRGLFAERVVAPFVEGYRSGSTPSPCVRCNEHVKLGPLLEIAERLACDAVATGHYARIAHGPDGEVDLRMGTDRARDQSYFLFAAPEASLRRLILPLGELTKPEARAVATRHGLINAAKPDSTDLCFVEGMDPADWIASRMDGGAGGGTIETVEGVPLGPHDGIHRFTPGQRRGVPGIDGKARFVLRIVPETRTVVVGTASQVERRDADVLEVRWLVRTVPERVTARLRYRHEGVDCQVRAGAGPDRVQLAFDTPQRGVAAGQAAVFYVDDRVVGGGFLA